MKQRRAFVHDYGRAEYLDGAMMQYSVLSAPYPNGETLAYFSHSEHATLFAKALARSVIVSTEETWKDISYKFKD